MADLSQVPAVPAVHHTPEEGNVAVPAVPAVRHTPEESNVAVPAVPAVHHTPEEGNVAVPAVPAVHHTPEEGNDAIEVAMTTTDEVPIPADPLPVVVPSTPTKESASSISAASLVLGTPTRAAKTNSPATPGSGGVAAFRMTPPPDPETPVKIQKKTSDLGVILDRIRKRHHENTEDIMLVTRELRRVEAMTKQHTYRQDCAERRRELDEVSILLDDDIDILQS